MWFEYKLEPYLNIDDFRAMYSGSYDIALTNLLRNELRSGDIFIDVGANVGYVSAVAASLVGRDGGVHSFEPLKPCFSRLEVLVRLNPGYDIVVNNFALGETETVARIAFSLAGDSRNATLVPGTVKAESDTVPVRRLDRYISATIRRPERIRLIKVDVEGFEFPVLLGLSEFFEGTPFRPLIVCEIKPWELPKLNYTVDQFDSYMKRYSYQAFSMVNRWRKVDFAKRAEFQQVLFRAQKTTI